MNRERVNPSPQFPPGVALLPEDFCVRLEKIKEITGLTWEGMSVCLGGDIRQVQYWRKGGTPNGGAMLSLVELATRVPEGLSVLLNKDLEVVYRGRD